MNKELIDRVWNHCLPKEFKEEVKRMWSVEVDCATKYKSELHKHRTDLLYELFGEHLHWQNNLTSDAEGEEMLTVPRKRVMEIYNHCNGGGAQVIEDIFGKLTYDMDNDAIITPLDKFKGLPHLNEKQEVITDYEGYAPTLYPYEGQWFVSWISSEGDSILDFQAESPEKAIELAYNHLFGSKCLPDEKASISMPLSEPKPFKYSVGQKVILHFYGGEVSTITEAFNDGGVWNKYKVKMLPTRVWNENELDPYEEPKSTEPKLKVGDMVRIKGDGYEPNLHKGDVGEVLDINDKEQCFVLFKKSQAWIYTDCLEPYTEPKEKNHIAQDLEMVDNIIKDGFSKERRLNIAAMIAQGVMANSNPKMVDMNVERVVDLAILTADALIAECERKGEN